MRDNELKRERDCALYAAYTEAIRNHDFANVMEAVEFIRLRPAPKFYLDAFTAAIYISNLERGIIPDGIHETSRRKIDDIYKLYQQYRSDHPEDTRPRLSVLEEIVDMPAPEFYLSPHRAKHIILDQRKIVRKKIVK